jgi:hypothetical protein
MANHIRRQIRDALKARLTNLATTGSNVFGNRVEVLSDAELPALLLMNDTDAISARAIGSQAAPHARNEQRTISYKIRATVKANANPDDILDQICLEVEKAINSDIFMGGLTDDARLMSTVYELDSTLDRLLGIADMVWEFDTWVSNTAPDMRA